MSRIIESLKNLYVKLGGTASTVADVTQTPDMINAIADVYQDKGDTLPTVTTDDNAKLLTVVAGKWDKAVAPTELPAVTGDDNGKVLKVAEGAWGKGDIPTELPAVTADDNGKVLKVVDGAWAAVLETPAEQTPNS